MEKALLNAVLREDSVGIQVDKTKATLKIDVVDAIIDAMTQAMYHFEEFGMVNDATWQVEHMSAQQVADWFNVEPVRNLLCTHVFNLPCGIIYHSKLFKVIHRLCHGVDNSVHNVNF